MSLLNQASIYFGKVIHQRYVPANRFLYSVFYLRIPMRSRRLDPHLLSKSGIGDNRFSWMSFYDKDHGDSEYCSLEWVENILKNLQCNDIDGEIWLHAFPRILGFVFNPVSFWFCHNSNQELKIVIAEVNNTFGERHTYVLKSEHDTPLNWGQDLHANKIFHVSPFFDVIGSYRFRFMKQSGEIQHPKFVSRIDYFQDQTHTLMTSISGSEYPLTRTNTMRAILLFPIMTFSIVLKIHWQAFKLWIKGAKFFKKPNPPEVQIS